MPAYIVVDLNSTSTSNLNDNKCCCYDKDKNNENCTWFEKECPEGTEDIISNSEAIDKCANSVKTVLQVPIPKVGGGSLRLVESYGQYVNTIYKWMIGIASILAVLVIMISGLEWILAAGNAGKIGKAKGKIKNSLLAIFFISVSYLILAVVNPKLLNLGILIQKVPAIGLDIKKGPLGSGNCSQMIGDAESANSSDNVTTYDGLLRQAAIENNIDCDYLKAILLAESHGNPNAESNEGACGLMQVLPRTAGKSCDELKDPFTGIEAGARYASQLLNTAGGDFNLLSAAYNGGPGALGDSNNCPGFQKWQCLYDNDAHTTANVGYQETRTYVQRTQGYLNMIVENNLSCNGGGIATASICTSGGNGAKEETASSFEIVTQSEAEDWLRSAGITVESSGNCSDRTRSTCTSLEGIRRSTIAEIVRLKGACGNNCSVAITAGNEVGHTSGDLSHSRGYKVDLRLDNNLTRFIRANYTKTGSRDGEYAADLYAGPNGVVYALEDNHWDVLVP